MEKWRSRGKSLSKEESILPPTRRPSTQNCLPIDKKKDKKWSFGSLLRRISSGQQNDVSSNDEEDITYIPGHMLAKKKTKRTSKMKSKLGKLPRERLEDEKSAIGGESILSINENNDVPDHLTNSGTNVEQSQDSLCGTCNDSINSPSSEGSLDALGKNSRIKRMKARAQAKRDRLCANSSSEDDSHRSSQSSVRFRSEDNVQNISRTDSFNRRTRGARTERYIKRISRDDCLSDEHDTKTRKTMDLPRSISRESTSELFASPGYVDQVGNDSLKNERFYNSRLSARFAQNNEIDRDERQIRECEKFTWPKTNCRRSDRSNEIYGSLRTKEMVEKEDKSYKILPPEPPPRSSKSRIFTSVCNASFSYKNPSMNHPPRQEPHYQTRNIPNIRSYNSDNEIFQPNYYSRMPNTPRLPIESNYRDDENYTNRAYEQNKFYPTREFQNDGKYREENKPYENVKTSTNQSRKTCSLPKGVELFSRQKLAHCQNEENDKQVPDSSSFAKDEWIVNQSVPRRIKRTEDSHNDKSLKILEDNEAERKRSSKNLQEALCELEAIYNSLRLSDPDLLDRAEKRTMDEYRDNAAKNAIENSTKNCSETLSYENNDFCNASYTPETNSRMSDDMAYRRMNPKERPSSVNGQSSLSQISYLATSPNLSIRDNDFYDQRSRRSTPDLTRDDLLFRSISHSINTLKVIEPQPPFGIPLGPVTGSTESDYLHVTPKSTKHEKTRSLYIPKTEPDIVSDDLAFRNLRKDKDSCLEAKKNSNIYSQTDSLIEPSFNKKYETPYLGTRAKNSTPLNDDCLKSSDTDWYRDYAKTRKKFDFHKDDQDCLNTYDLRNNKSRIFDETRNSMDRRNKIDLDINGNQSKSALEKNIQVHVPRDVPSWENKKYLSDNDVIFSRDSRKSIITESEDSSPERYSDWRNSSASDTQRIEDENNIEQFTEEEVSEYKKLCQDLEKLIKQTSNEETTNKDNIEDDDSTKEENNSQSEVDDWERLFNDGYEIPQSLLNFSDHLEIPNREREEDRSSSQSLGLSSENLSKKRHDKFADDDLFSSASELGACSNNESLTDSVYDKFNQLLREVNDLPQIELKNIPIKYPTENFNTLTGDSGTGQSILESKLLDKANDKKLEKSENKNTSKIFGSPKKQIDNEYSKNNYKYSGGQVSLLQKQNDYIDAGSQVEAMRQKKETEDKDKKLENREGSKNIPDDNLARKAETKNLASFARKPIVKLVKDNLSSSNSESCISSNEESYTDSVYDKFDELLRDVKDVPLVECRNKIGKYPADESVALTRDLGDFESIYKDEAVGYEKIVDSGRKKKDDEDCGILVNASQVLELTKKNSTANDNTEDRCERKNLQLLKNLTRRVRNGETNEEIDGKVAKGETRPTTKFDKNDDDEKLTYLEG